MVHIMASQQIHKKKWYNNGIAWSVSSSFSPHVSTVSVILSKLLFILPVEANYCTYSPDPNLAQPFELLPHREVYSVCWCLCVQFCKVIGWACRVGLERPQGWISTSVHIRTHRCTHIRTHNLNEVRVKQRFKLQHSSLLIVPQGSGVNDYI